MAKDVNIKKLVESLHPLERRVLPLVEDHALVSELAVASDLKDVEVSRALQWLSNKGAVSVSAQPFQFVVLDKNGEVYKKKGLPERRFLEVLKSQGALPINKLSAKTELQGDEVNVCVGLLRALGAILLLKEKVLSVKITDKGLSLLSEQFPEEAFLERSFPLNLADLSSKDKLIVDGLRRRKNFVRVDVVKQKSVVLTELGKRLVESGVHDENLIDSISSDVLKSGSWKGKTFRRYDLTSPVPLVFGGKKQSYRVFLDSMRQKFISLGFSEMSGPIVESDFWDMDALFMPQFHSAREIHDAYYVSNPKSCELDDRVVKRVKDVHESGGKTGSLGWRYPFDVERTRRLLLRTQATACSARKLGSQDVSIPGRYFGIARCFRRDVIDATHLVDFNQTEGIIIEEGLTFRHLVGLLELFAREFAGAQEIRVVPGYFPFTEPSAELFAKHPQLGWVELGGAGIFRPEVVEPLLGKKITVLAWGLGIDRIGMFKLGFKDVRNLFSHDLAFLRKSPVV